jgi:hypothetical protein
MIRVKLACGHWFDVGFLTQEEESARSTSCPKCSKVVGIVEARRLKHPPDSKKKWVEGEKVL